MPPLDVNILLNLVPVPPVWHEQRFLEHCNLVLTHSISVPRSAALATCLLLLAMAIHSRVSSCSALSAHQPSVRPHRVREKLESLPPDLTAAAEGGGITGENVWRFAEMEARCCSAGCCTLEASGIRCLPTTSSTPSSPRGAVSTSSQKVCPNPDGWMFLTFVLILSRMIFKNEVTSLCLV
jgi:hypothetical protein